MNIIHQQAAFAEDIAALIRWIKECGHLPTLLSAENLSAELKIFSYDSFNEVDTKIYEEIGSYWQSRDPLNRWGAFTAPCRFLRKETE